MRLFMNSQANSITNEKSCGRVYTPLFIVNNVLDLSEYYEDNIKKSMPYKEALI